MSRLALSCLGLGNSLLASASWVDSACLLLLAACASTSFFLLASASCRVDSACRLAAWASASFILLASAFWVDSAWRFIQIGLALRNFAVYARTPPYQNYGHASSPGIPGLYSIDRIKMADDHNVKQETAEGSVTARLGVRDFEIHWISHGFRISEWISGFQNGFLDFRMDFWISKWIS